MDKQKISAKATFGIIFLVVSILILAVVLFYRFKSSFKVVSGGKLILNEITPTIIPNIVVPTLSEEETTYISKAKNYNVVITDKEVTIDTEKLKPFDFTFFKNNTNQKVYVELVKYNSEAVNIGKISILPGKTWTRNYQQEGDYFFEITGLSKLLKIKVTVIK